MQRLIDPHGTWAVPRPQDRPAFTGLIVWRDSDHRVSLLYPKGWQCHLDTVTQLLPPSDSPFACTVSVQASRLPFPVSPDDLDAFREGVVSGIHSLPAAVVDRCDAEVVGALLDVEVEHRFDAPKAPGSEAGVQYRRWLRCLYQADVQFSISAEAPMGEPFDYWHPVFTSIMRTAIFADWTAEVTGRSWEPLDTAPAD